MDHEYPAFYIAETLSKKKILIGSEVYEAYRYFAEIVREHDGLISPEEFVSLVRDNWDSIKERFPSSVLENIDEPKNDADDLVNPFNLSSEKLLSNSENPNSYGIDSFIAPVMLILWGNRPRISHGHNTSEVPL